MGWRSLELSSQAVMSACSSWRRGSRSFHLLSCKNLHTLSPERSPPRHFVLPRFSACGNQHGCAGVSCISIVSYCWGSGQWGLFFFLVRSKETTFTVFSWSVVNLTNKESSGPGLSAQFSGRSSIFWKFSGLLKIRPWFLVVKSVAGNSTYCTTPDTSLSLMLSRLDPIYCWFQLRASFPWVSVALAEWQTAVCISTALSSLSYLHEKKS